MSGRTEVYAEALYAVAIAEGNLGEVEDELFRFARVLDSNDELRDKLADPHLPAALRQQIVEDLLDGKAQSTTVGLISLLVGNGRARELPAIVDAMLGFGASRTDKEVAEVRSAIELDDDQRARLATALESATGKKVDVRVIVDPAIRGGLVVQVGDTVIDGSVRRRLDQLRHAL